MFVYTNKYLAKVIPIQSLNWEDCGINADSVEVLITNNTVNCFFEVTNEEKFNSVKFCDVEKITKEVMKKRIKEIENIIKKEKEERYKNTDAYNDFKVLKKEIEELKNKISSTTEMMDEMILNGVEEM